jgi:hypothetical protein
VGAKAFPDPIHNTRSLLPGCLSTQSVFNVEDLRIFTDGLDPPHCVLLLLFLEKLQTKRTRKRKRKRRMKRRRAAEFSNKPEALV